MFVNTYIPKQEHCLHCGMAVHDGQHHECNPNTGWYTSTDYNVPPHDPTLGGISLNQNKMKLESEFWLGGSYEQLGVFNTRIDAERGQTPNIPLHELLQSFDGKKVRLTVEVIED